MKNITDGWMPIVYKSAQKTSQGRQKLKYINLTTEERIRQKTED